MAIADHIVDMGPGAGKEGGTVVFEGTFAALKNSLLHFFGFRAR